MYAKLKQTTNSYSRTLENLMKQSMNHFHNCYSGKKYNTGFGLVGDAIQQLLKKLIQIWVWKHPMVIKFGNPTIIPKGQLQIELAKNFRQLPNKLTTIYYEIIESFNNDAKILCAIGLRALLEGICADKNIEHKNIYGKIEGLKALLPHNIVSNLHGFRFMGNEAAHELQAPSRHELELAMEVIEDLLNYLYELEYKASRLRKE
jgi:hypothetical protein